MIKNLTVLKLSDTPNKNSRLYSSDTLIEWPPTLPVLIDFNKKDQVGIAEYITQKDNLIICDISLNNIDNIFDKIKDLTPAIMGTVEDKDIEQLENGVLKIKKVELVAIGLTSIPSFDNLITIGEHNVKF